MLHIQPLSFSRTRKNTSFLEAGKKIQLQPVMKKLPRSWETEQETEEDMEKVKRIC